MRKDIDSVSDSINNLNEVIDLIKNRWGDLAPEAFAGLLSTVISDQQLKALVKNLRKEYGNTKREQDA